jgi:hypothetical protein
VDPDPFWVNAADYGWGPVDMGWVPTTQGTGDTNPADDELDSHAGHATFIAGLIRQVAPDARVLSAPIMRTGGVVDEDAVLYTLRWVRDRVRGAAADSTLFVDIVSLSFGYYEQAAENAFHTSKLREVLGELGDLGVRVVAAAGNRASADPVYPAALAGAPWAGDAPETRLISVGALNPDGSRAVYSNHGDWVTHWDFGTAVAGPTPPFGQQAARGQTAEYDPENLVGGFASWAGTSFATGLFAGRLAAELMADPRWAGQAQTMTPAAAHQRAAWALAALTPS